MSLGECQSPDPKTLSSPSRCASATSCLSASLPVWADAGPAIPATDASTTPAATAAIAVRRAHRHQKTHVQAPGKNHHRRYLRE